MTPCATIREALRLAQAPVDIVPFDHDLGSSASQFLGSAPDRLHREGPHRHRVGSDTEARRLVRQGAAGIF